MSGLRDAPALVVGGLGFIGVNLTSRLVSLGARVTVLTPARSRHERAALGFERDGVEIVEGDLRDRELMARLVAPQRVIVNLSGQSGAVRSMDDPWSDLDVNCRGNLVLLEALREHNRHAKVVFAGSRLQYGRPASVPVPEDAAAEPLCLHAIHKRTVEGYLKLYGRLFGVTFAIARITNPYGPGQPDGRTAYGIVNRMIQQALAGETLTIYGDGSQLRDYVHVDDVADALVAMAESSAADGRTFNVGSGTGTALAEVASRIVSLAGSGRIERVAWPQLAGQIETGDFVADITRIHRELGWAPGVPLSIGLERTVSFYRTDAAS